MNNKMLSDKMRTAPIGKLLTQMALPAIFSMLVHSMYNVVDSLFVARISGDALTALSYAFPMQIFVLAIALGIGVGSNSVISRRLGEQDYHRASRTAQTGLFMAVCMGVLFAFIGYPLSKIFIEFTTLGNSIQNIEIISMAISYLSIVLCCSVGLFVELHLSRTLQATGNMILPMISQLIGAVVNIILDPLLIFGIGFFPELGVQGAAIATVIGQVCAMTFMLIAVVVKKHDIKLFSKSFRLKKEYLIPILKIGTPVMIMNAIMAITTTIMNLILRQYTDTAVAVLGIYFKLQSFVFMPIFGLCQGAMPIFGYNYGANNKERFYKTYKLSIMVSLAIITMGFLVFQIFPEQLLRLFKADQDMMSIGIVALRNISWSFIPAAFGIVNANMFQSIGHGMKSLIMSLLRQLVYIIPISILFGKLWGLDAIWLSYPTAELLTHAIFIPLSFMTMRKIFKAKDNQLSSVVENKY